MQMIERAYHFDMLDDIQNARVLRETTDTNTVRVLAVDVLNGNVSRIPLEREAIVSRHDVGIT